VVLGLVSALPTVLIGFLLAARGRIIAMPVFTTFVVVAVFFAVRLAIPQTRVTWLCAGLALLSPLVHARGVWLSHQLGKWWWLGGDQPTGGCIAGSRIFRLPLVYRLLMSNLLSLAICIPAAILIAGLVEVQIEWILWLSILLLTVFFLDLLLWSNYSLAVSSAGVEFRSPLHRIRTTWSNIEAISEVGGWTRPVQGLLLREPVKPFPWLALIIAFPRGDIPRSIPLEIFAVRNWQASAVGREIGRYAPHLLGTKSV